MRATGITANLTVSDIDTARSFYADYLGLSVEEMNLGWVARYRSPDGRAYVQLVTRDHKYGGLRHLRARWRGCGRGLRGNTASRLRDRSSVDR
jgi:catechol 2,3-dioxygenase-like lactoylglutathione lyase family enzyme